MPTTVETGSLDRLSEVVGAFDENLNLIARELGLTVRVEGTRVVLEGEGAAEAVGAEVVESLLRVLSAGETIDRARILYCIELAREGHARDIEEVMHGVIAISSRGKPVKCKTVGQKKYVEAVKSHTITFGVGPAGTGKTYLAVCLAVAAYNNILKPPPISARKSRRSS